MNRTAKPSISELQNESKFQLLEAFSPDEVVFITRKYLFQKSLLTIFYVFANLFAVSFAAWNIYKSESSLTDSFSSFGLGFLVCFLLLLPLHEYVHLLAYKVFGAKKVRVEYRWRQISAFCLADDFLIGGANFLIVALAPFIFINSLILAVSFFANNATDVFLSGLLLLHVGACSGDVGLSNLIWRNRQTKIWTFDDSATKKSYFYKEQLN